MSNPTAARVAEQIKTITAQMLQRRIQDPRLGFLTITDVRLSKDWRRCELFYTVLGTAGDRVELGSSEDSSKAWADAAAALEQAKGQIRTQVSRQLKLRFAPELIFVADAMPEQSAHIDRLLLAAREFDERVAGMAQDAEPAGEADPYKESPVSMVGGVVDDSF